MANVDTDKIIPARFRYEVPTAIERRANYIKFGVLGFVLVYYLVTHDHLIYRYVEPFWMFTGNGDAVMWTGLAVLLTATSFLASAAMSRR